MRVLITGINGFVGGHLAAHLLASGGWQVWGMARRAEADDPELRGRVTIVAADLVSLDQVVATLDQVRPAVIFHLAGQSNVPRSFEDPAGTLMTNVLAQLHLFQAALRLRQDPLIVIAGSNEIYGRVRPEELPV